MRSELELLTKVSRCPDKVCRVLPGDVHDPECAIAICVVTGEQRILHVSGRYDVLRSVIGLAEHDVDGHDCGADVWTGEQAGAADCRRFGWYSRLGRGTDKHLGWIPCAADHPDAHLDFFRLWTDAVWCPVERRWVQREDALGGSRG